MTERDLLWQFIASLTLCDHMGDVQEAVSTVLERVLPGKVPEDFDGLRVVLARMGVSTLHGTPLTGAALSGIEGEDKQARATPSAPISTDTKDTTK